MLDRPGRMVRMSASGLTCAAVMPYARSSCGVATYTGPSQLRPGAARCSAESVVSSRTMSRDPSEAAMPRACGRHRRELGARSGSGTRSARAGRARPGWWAPPAGRRRADSEPGWARRSRAALPNRAAAITQMMTAMSTLRLIAPSAAPERARYLARSRRASRTTIGARRAALASSARHVGATSTTPAHSTIRPTTRARKSVDLFPVLGGGRRRLLTRQPDQEEREHKQSDAGRPGPAASLPRGRRPPRERGDDRQPGDRPGGSDGRQVRRQHGERHRHEDHQPGQLEGAHDVVSAGFGARAVRQPGRQAEREPGHRADNPGREAVGADHEPDVGVRGTLRAEHADRAQPPLRQHREPAHADQRDEQHPERGRGQRDGHRVDHVGVGRRRPRHHVSGPASGDSRPARQTAR